MEWYEKQNLLESLKQAKVTAEKYGKVSEYDLVTMLDALLILVSECNETEDEGV